MLHKLYHTYQQVLGCSLGMIPVRQFILILFISTMFLIDGAATTVDSLKQELQDIAEDGKFKG